MTPEERSEIIRLLKSGNELSPEWARVLFPPEKREYAGKVKCMFIDPS